MSQRVKQNPKAPGPLVLHKQQYLSYGLSFKQVPQMTPQRPWTLNNKTRAHTLNVIIPKRPKILSIVLYDQLFSSQKVAEIENVQSDLRLTLDN